MKLHIFNPEHDLALAANIDNYTAPHAGRQLRRDLAFIPALWAEDHNFVLVDDIDDANDKVRHLGDIYINKVEFITPLQLSEVFKNTMLVDSIHPWGWDKALVYQLKALGCPDIMLPGEETLARIREVSGRKWAATNLQEEANYVEDANKLRLLIQQMGKAVVKAPWSSSGRGVRYISLTGEPRDAALVGGSDLEATLRWAANVMRQQGGVTVESYYHKVRDFGMEFEMKDGKLEYKGLSLFDTVKGAYMGNVLATEQEKEEMLLATLGYQGERVQEGLTLLEDIRGRIVEKVQPTLHNIYGGPIGIDMMVFADGEGKLKVNECVELNLRRTMGHVALALSGSEKKVNHLMRVDYDGNRYRLRVRPIQKTAGNELI